MVAVTVGRGQPTDMVKQLDRGPASKVAEVGWNPSWSPTGSSSCSRHPAVCSSVCRPTAARCHRRSRPWRHALAVSDGKWLLFSSQGDSSVFAQTAIPHHGSSSLIPSRRWVRRCRPMAAGWRMRPTSLACSRCTFDRFRIRKWPSARCRLGAASRHAGRDPAGDVLCDGNSDFWAVDVARVACLPRYSATALLDGSVRSSGPALL